MTGDSSVKKKSPPDADTKYRSGKDPVHTVTPAAPDGNLLAVLTSGLRGIFRYHQLMGIEAYPCSPTLRQILCPAKQPGNAADYRQEVSEKTTIAHVVPRESGKSRDDHQLPLFQKKLQTCRNCSLSDLRQGVVIGRGHRGASLCVVGDYSLQEGLFSEAVLFGPDEDIMLWNMMKAIGLVQDAVYVTNVLKCCPDGVTQPSGQNMLHCRQYLYEEIALVEPKVLCAMGEEAAHALIDTEAPLFSLRGRFHPYRNNRSTRVMVTLHPRLLLKNASLKRAAWEDLQMVERLLQTM